MAGNVQALRKADGNIAVIVAGHEMVGTKNVQIAPDGAGGMTLVMGVNMMLVEFAEIVEPEPAVQAKDSNVVYAFGATPPADDVTTDGDSE